MLNRLSHPGTPIYLFRGRRTRLQRRRASRAPSGGSGTAAGWAAARISSRYPRWAPAAAARSAAAAGRSSPPRRSRNKAVPEAGASQGARDAERRRHEQLGRRRDRVRTRRPAPPPPRRRPGPRQGHAGGPRWGRRPGGPGTLAGAAGVGGRRAGAWESGVPPLPGRDGPGRARGGADAAASWPRGTRHGNRAVWGGRSGRPRRRRRARVSRWGIGSGDPGGPGRVVRPRGWISGWGTPSGARGGSGRTPAAFCPRRTRNGSLGALGRFVSLGAWTSRGGDLERKAEGCGAPRAPGCRCPTWGSRGSPSPRTNLAERRTWRPRSRTCQFCGRATSSTPPSGRRLAPLPLLTLPEVRRKGRCADSGPEGQGHVGPAPEPSRSQSAGRTDRPMGGLQLEYLPAQPPRAHQ